MSNPPPEIIVVCGMLWTGSGALGDFLFDHEGVGRINDTSFTAETAFTKGQYSLGYIYKTIRKGKPIDGAALTSLRHFLMGDPDAFSPEVGKKIAFNLARNALVARRLGDPFRRAVENLVSALEPAASGHRLESTRDVVHGASPHRLGAPLRRAVEKLAPAFKTAPSSRKLESPCDIFQHASRSFFTEFSSLIPDKQFLAYRKYLILNNDPNGTNISFLNCVRSTAAFLVVRNPLDTFANTVLRNYYTATERDARSYAVMMRDRIDRFIEDYRQGDFGGGRLKALVFEDFVTNSTFYEEKIRQHIPLGARRGNRFNPSVSSQKVGIGRSLPPDVRALLEARAVPDWNRLLAFLAENKIMLSA